MTVDQVVERFLAGAFVAIGEYRSSKCEMLNWRDKQTGRAMSAPLLRHTVEFGADSVHVAERVPDGMTLEQIQIPFVKGERVACTFTEFTSERGTISARGKLEKLAPSPVKPEQLAVGGTRK